MLLGTIRRTKQSTDYCRRRRWTRTRVPVKYHMNATISSVNKDKDHIYKLDERNRPLAVFWDVQTLKSGSKHVSLYLSSFCRIYYCITYLM